MSAKYTNNLQAAVLYKGKAEICPEAFLIPFLEAMHEKGLPLAPAQTSDTYALFLGPDELHISVSYLDHPANHGVFVNTLRSKLTNMLMEDAPTRVQCHSSHVLIEIWHGVLGGVTDKPEIADFLNEIDLPQPGHSLEAFNLRCNILAEICRHLTRLPSASAIHWTQSNMLIAAEQIEGFIDQVRPGMLTVHPVLYGGDAVPGHDEPPVGLMTLGAADYIGREIHVVPAPVPWVDLYETALAFIRVAIMPNGYVIPDDDTFADETGEFSYRVRHLEGAETVSPDGAPCYQLSLMFSKEHNYTAPDHQPRELVPGGISEATSMLEAEGQESDAQVTDWQEKQRMAKAAGGDVQIFRTQETGPTTEPSGPKSFGAGSNGQRPVFGKRKAFGRRQ